MNDWKQKPKRMTQQDHADEANWEGRFAAIEKEADAILKAEGAFKVRGVYFVLESDATIARMVEAERRVAKRDESMDRYIGRRFPMTTAPCPKGCAGGDTPESCEDCHGSVIRVESATHCPEMSVTEGAES